MYIFIHDPPDFLADRADRRESAGRNKHNITNTDTYIPHKQIHDTNTTTHYYYYYYYYYY